MRNKQEYVRLLISLLISCSLIAFLLWLLMNKFVVNNISTNYKESSLQDDFSLGEKFLLQDNINSNKTNGAKAFADGDFNTAIEKFQSSLNTNPNDPETLIYLNNAKIGKSNFLKIAVLVGIGSVDVDRIEETLRGVAQAQQEVNTNGGINGTPLQVEIVKNANNPELDQQLANDSDIMAVVGYKDTTVFQDKELVTVSTFNPSNYKTGGYVFYVTPSQQAFSDTLAQYIVKQAHVDAIAICEDSKSYDTNPTLKNILPQYKQSIQSHGGKIVDINCDFSNAKFLPSTTLEKVRTAGAEGILMLPAYNNINPALELAKENQGKLKLFSNQLMYQGDVLKSGADIKGTVLVVSWFHDAIPGNPFAENAAKLWHGPVSPSTAAAYDATQTIISGLKVAHNRSQLQKALADPNFSAQGATKVQFTAQGDRQGGVFLVKIEPCDPTRSCNSGTDYNYVLAGQ